MGVNTPAQFSFKDDANLQPAMDRTNSGVEMSAHDEVKNGEGLSLHLDEVHDSSITDLTVFKERQRTPEEKKIERKLLLKIDFIILPLLALVYFLASMVFWL